MLLVKNFTSTGEWTPIDIVEDITGLTKEEIMSSSETVEITDEDCEIMSNYKPYEPFEEDVEKHWLEEAEWAD